MSWRWKEPGPGGRQGSQFETRDEAVRNAVHCALVTKGAAAREIEPDQVPGLWRSMKTAGWAVYRQP